MNLRKDCELVEVTYQNEKKKAVLTFLDRENGQILEVNFNKQVYDNGSFVDDKEKAEKVEEWCKEYFDTTFDKLSSRIGDVKDVYNYENFNSLWEVTVVKKFDKEDKGKIFETNIERIEDNGKGIHIYFKYNDEEYVSKMMYAQYLEHTQEWFENPVKKNQQFTKFEEKFGVSVENADEIIGKSIMVEVKVAFNKFPYAEIKKTSWN